MDNNLLSNNSKGNNFDVSSILENNSKFDLVDIMCNNILGQIKKEIQKTIDQKRAQSIDEEFKKSLKPIVAANLANNTQLSGDYIKELSYIYFALFNNTIQVYYDMKNSNTEIEYYMLDEEYANNINDKKIDWTKYRKYLTESTFVQAYNNGVLNELISILDINPNFEISSYDCEYLFNKDFFDKIMEFYGIDIIANSQLDILETGINEENREYTKELIRINPNIKLDSCYIFNSKLKEVFDVNAIANFSKKEFEDIEIIISWGSEELISVYKELIEINPDFTFYATDFFHLISDKNFNIPLEVVANLSKEEQRRMGRLYDDSKHYVSPFINLVADASAEKIHKAGAKSKLKRLIKKEIKK